VFNQAALRKDVWGTEVRLHIFSSWALGRGKPLTF